MGDAFLGDPQKSDMVHRLRGERDDVEGCVSALPANVERATRRAALWVRGLTNDWVVVKGEIMTELDNDGRALFGRRDEKTKEVLSLNPMEETVVAFWKGLTGVDLEIRSFKTRREVKWWKPVISFDDE